MKIILILSDSKVLMEKKIKEITKNSSNQMTYWYKENSIQDILEEASYVSLFADEKYVIVKNVDFFGKGKVTEKEQEQLLGYFDHPNPNTTIIFTMYEEMDHRKALSKKISEVGEVFSVFAPKNYELFKEIKKELNYRMEDHTIRYMIEACLSNYDLIHKEMEKLELIFPRNAQIQEEELKKIIVPNANENIFKFIDSVIQKDIYLTFHLLEDLQLLKYDVFQLMNLLAREYRLIYYFKLLERKGLSSKEISQNLKLQEWQIEKLRKESFYYHEDDLKDRLVSLAKLDVECKNGEKEKNLAFQSFLIDILEY